jgi:hypothetical protein
LPSAQRSQQKLWVIESFAKPLRPQEADHGAARVLEGVRAKLLRPEAIRERTNRRREVSRRMTRLKTEIEQPVDQVCSSAATPASNARLVALDGVSGERERVEEELSAPEADDGVMELHPGAIERYTRAVAARPRSRCAAAWQNSSRRGSAYSARSESR